MQVLVGLGNPGRQYEGHRHNVGFMALDLIAARYNAPKWKERANAMVTECRIDGDKVVLVKPQSFMNKSGQPLRHVLDFWKLKAEAVTVFYDELDLQPSKVRIKRGGGSGGHNGIKSLDAHIGQNYRRVRLGIGHPGHKDRVAGYVLHDFGKDERAQLDVLLSAMADNLQRLLDGDESGFMSLSMQALAPDRGAQRREKPSVSPGASAGASSEVPAQPTTIGKGPPTALGAALSRLLNRNADKKTDKE
ncbi:MAG: aminoacyl-tRNA hydrolase [Alphaproteobacteria bacterium]|nr:aminoacyl-tRNA hydrolase [Alphaproteobacteria bacterium]